MNNVYVSIFYILLNPMPKCEILLKKIFFLSVPKLFLSRVSSARINLNILIKSKLRKTAFILWIQMRVGRHIRVSDVNSAMPQIRSTPKCCVIRIFKTIAYFSWEMCYCYKQKIWWISLLYDSRCHEVFTLYKFKLIN